MLVLWLVMGSCPRPAGLLCRGLVGWTRGLRSVTPALDKWEGDGRPDEQWACLGFGGAAFSIRGGGCFGHSSCLLVAWVSDCSFWPPELRLCRVAALRPWVPRNKGQVFLPLMGESRAEEYSTGGRGRKSLLEAQSRGSEATPA